MILQIEGHDFHYEMENLCRIFFPYEKIVTTADTAADDAIVAYTGVFEYDDKVELRASLKIGGEKERASQEVTPAAVAPEKELERLLAVLLFGLLEKLCGYRPQWGILTGVRPIKLLRKLREDMGEQEALDYFRKGLLVNEKKTEKSLATMGYEQAILSTSRPDSFSLYISIPFCPTRCAYCSFVSQSVVRAARLIPRYVELLCLEIAKAAEVAGDLGLRLESVYMGGGTPTALTAEQLAQVVDAVNRSFDLSSCREFTVEAGRPDTITAEKLLALKERGVSRISINPQTLNDEVLEAIGRKHTSAQTLEAYSLARKLGVSNINMDLIVGLPRDSVESFRMTLDRVLELAPESVTVHALSLKRSSHISQSGGRFEEDAETADSMMDYADNRLSKNGYLPYYLYRQSRMVGNLENTGWAKPGKESVYNVFVMDETHTVIACGAGAVTKVKEPGKDNLKRIFNFKFPYEYIDRFEEMMTRKGQVREFYEQFCK